MTVAALPASISYVENGSTVSFSVPFRFNAITDLTATRTAADGTTRNLAFGSDFNVTGGATDFGGTLVVTAAAIAGTLLKISRATPRRQGVQYTTGDRFPAVMTEQTFDIAMLIDQEQDDHIGDIRSRSFLVPPGEVAQTIQPRAMRAGKVFAWDANGNAIAVGGAVRLPGYPQNAVRQALVDAGLMQRVLDFLPPEGTNPIRIQWDTGTPVQVGDVLYGYIQSATGYTLGQMSALLAAAGSSSIALPDYAASLDPNGLIAFLAYLATSNGGSLMGSRRSTLPNSAAVLTQQQRNDLRFDLAEMEGFDPTGATDNLEIVQIAFNEAAAAGMPLYVPAGVIALSGKVQVPQGCTVFGSGRSRGVPATRFHFTDTGDNVGFICGDGLDIPQVEDGFLFRDIVVSQEQPAPPPTGPWAPHDTPALFVMNGSTDLDLEHVLFLNATRAVNMLGGGGIGRLNMDNCGGQVFIYGVNIELAADTCKFTNVHWWPFWSDTLPVNNYSCAHADHFIIKRCDSPQFLNVSSIAGRTGFLFTTNAFGSASRVVIGNASMDYAARNYWFDPSCVGASVWVTNTTMQANNSDGAVANVAAVPTRINIEMQGTNNYFAVLGADFGGSSGPAVWNHGTSCEVHLGGGLFVHEYGTVAGNTDGCFVTIGDCRTYIETVPRVDAAGLGKLIDGNGYTSSPIRRTYTPTISYGGSPSGGSFTAAGSYIVQDKRVIVEVDVTITAAPTGTLSELLLTLPFSSEAQTGIGYGSYYANSTAALAVRVQSGMARTIVSTTGAAPVTVGSFRIHFEYLIA